jgi:hypothetical protein
MDGISKKGKKCGRTQWRTSLPPWTSIDVPPWGGFLGHKSPSFTGSKNRCLPFQNETKNGIGVSRSPIIMGQRKSKSNSNFSIEH